MPPLRVASWLMAENKWDGFGELLSPLNQVNSEFTRESTRGKSQLSSVLLIWPVVTQFVDRLSQSKSRYQLASFQVVTFAI